MNLLLAAAVATAVCGQADELRAILDTQHQEHIAARGLAGNHGMGLLELYVSEGGKTYSLLLVLPDGTACLMAAGEDWQPVVMGRGV